MAEPEHDESDKPLTLRTLLSRIPYLLFAVPTNPHEVPLANAMPEGLALVHMAATTAEADLLRQVLADAGFHPEFVPSHSTGVFGTSGSPYVCVRKDEAGEVREFLSHYFDAPEPPDTGQA